MPAEPADDPMMTSTAEDPERPAQGPAAVSTGRSPRRKLTQLASGSTSEDIAGVSQDSALPLRQSSGTSPLACLMTPIRRAGVPACPALTLSGMLASFVTMHAVNAQA